MDVPEKALIEKAMPNRRNIPEEPTLMYFIGTSFIRAAPSTTPIPVTRTKASIIPKNTITG